MQAEHLQPIDPDIKVNLNEVVGLNEFDNWDNEKNTPEGRIKKALEIAMRSGNVDEGGHKAWVIDQMVRALTGCPVVLLINTRALPRPIIIASLGESEEYLKFIKEHNEGEEGPDTYKWDEGIPL